MISTRIAVLRTLPFIGLRRLQLYLIHRIKSKIGWYRSISPKRHWNLCEHNCESAKSVFNPPDLSLFDHHDEVRDLVIDNANMVMSGQYQFFDTHWLSIEGNWKRNPLSNFVYPDSHWSRIGEFVPSNGDIKWVWEPSRFQWVFQLARAWAITSNEEYIETFWKTFDHWRQQNPPNTGPNWICAQECSLRLISLVWVSGVFEKSGPTTEERQASLWQTVAELAERIQCSLGYSIAQNNNHALSEAAALYIAGVCMPNHSKSQTWKKTGKSLFEKMILEQFFTDGGYIQHSFIYTRLALRISLVFLIVSKKNKDSINSKVIDRIRKAVNFLKQVQNETTGAVPNYGANDGSNIFSLSTCKYGDFRPLLQSLSFVLDEKLLYGKGLYDEEIIWWFGLRSDGLKVDEPELTSFSAPESGYFNLRSQNSSAMIRCHSYRSRPSQADMLHLDLWNRGRNICPDGGTYSYNDEQGFGSYFKSTESHNTVSINGQSQMQPYRRFYWLNWTESRLITDIKSLVADPSITTWSGEHYGYLPMGAVHRRSLFMKDDYWLVCDDISLTKQLKTQVDLFWNFSSEFIWQVTNEIALVDEVKFQFFTSQQNNTKFEVNTGSHSSPISGRSFRYGEISSSTRLKISTETTTSLRYLTVIGSCDVQIDDKQLTWQGTKFPLQPDRNDLK